MDARIGFSDSNEISNGSSICCVTTNAETLSSEPSPPPDVSALRRLSENLESLFDSPGSDYYADAKIVVTGSSSSNGREILVHRCILASRSPFFKNVFATSAKEIKGVAEFELKELAKEHQVGVDAVEAVLAYLYSGKVRPLPKAVCVCVDADCLHVACRPVVDFMVEVLYASYTFQISELVALYQRQLLDILEKAAIDDILLVLSVANMCGKVCERLLARCIESIVKSDADTITLDKSLPQDIVKQIVDSRKELGLDKLESNSVPDKHVKRIHRALDSDDVELVRMLLKEGHTTLDDACALHYAVAYCDAKTTTELLDLGIADVNHRNQRGYTVLHVSAMRKEPKIIVSLLTKGARPSDLTLDGRNALQISKRLTKAMVYNKSPEEGKASPKDRLCIEILEQAERRDPLLGEAALSLAMAGDDLRMKLLYLENRVGLAKLLFPMEAKVAMDIAQVDGTSEFPLGIKSKNLGNAQRTTVDLNEAPFRIQEEHLTRMKALSRTVELGKRFFPRCSEVLNKIMDADDISELAYLGSSNPEERLLKKQRYMELQEVLRQAFNEDKEEFDKSAMSSSASSTSLGVVRSNGKLTIKK
ncbi:BTB/POZ domain and ankyrin repeat-containing protein NPR1 [Juglans microcarpa x Juglans regia]|uniref:BTB/POZ domain and ankyrin repeat-containing protein NPR1 n=1 Tax=Juglans microcarpa x Juglans regia TaxID=2249226 RepID=UPI001B7D98BA|nr:BTB/POZ domain and ankyrin repeat-containing protein NPR1 [Juglans microcarpa x Juglans regia]